jgi:hypothetical protein
VGSRMLVMTINHPVPLFDDSYAVNSASLGPYGDAIVTELIPEARHLLSFGVRLASVLGCSFGCLGMRVPHTAWSCLVGVSSLVCPRPV